MKRLGMKYLILFALLTPSFAHCADLTRLLNAKTVKEFDAESQLSEVVRLKREECAAELEMKVLPRSCFAVRRLESKKIESWLIEECEKRAKKSTSRLDLMLDTDDLREALPEKCRLAAEVRMADLDYLNPMAGQSVGN